jgi:hypothetical protein
MPEIIDYKDLQIVDPTPTGAGGEMINDNFVTIADILETLQNRSGIQTQTINSDDFILQHDNKGILLLTISGGGPHISNTTTPIAAGTVVGQRLMVFILSCLAEIQLLNNGNTSLAGPWVIGNSSSAPNPISWISLVWNGTTWREVARIQTPNVDIMGNLAAALNQGTAGANLACAINNGDARGDAAFAAGQSLAAFSNSAALGESSVCGNRGFAANQARVGWPANNWTRDDVSSNQITINGGDFTNRFVDGQNVQFWTFTGTAAFDLRPQTRSITNIVYDSGNNRTTFDTTSPLDNILSGKCVSFGFGTNSTAFGTGAALGSRNLVAGDGCESTGDDNIVTGSNNGTQGNRNAVSGSSHDVDGDNNLVGGNSNIIQGNQSLISGANNNVAASTNNAAAIGDSCVVQTGANNSIAQGNGSEVTAENCGAFNSSRARDGAAFSMNSGVADGDSSLAAGTSNTNGTASTALGAQSASVGSRSLASGYRACAGMSNSTALGDRNFIGTPVFDIISIYTGTQVTVSGDLAQFVQDGSEVSIFGLLGGSSTLNKINTTVVGSPNFNGSTTTFNIADSLEDRTSGRVAAGSGGQNSLAVGQFAGVNQANQSAQGGGLIDDTHGPNQFARKVIPGITFTSDGLLGLNDVYTLQDNSVFGMMIHIVGQEFGGAGYAYYTRRLLIRKQSGIATIIGTQTIGTDFESDASMDVAFSVSGGDLQIQVDQGSLVGEYHWMATVESHEIQSLNLAGISE